MKLPNFISATLSNRQIARQLIERDVKGRYRGSQLGLAWTIVSPLIMLSVYTLVFSQIFRARWGEAGGDQSPATFALNLFAGLLVFNMFAECATRSPSLITSNPNYVKKIIFPLHVLGTMVVGSALVHALTSTIILFMAKLIIDGSIPATAALLPLIWIPLTLGCLGMSWLLATVGVFLRDISQIMAAAVSMLMFLSPVFYPASALPNNLQWLASFNPIATVINETREVLLVGTAPPALTWISQVAIAMLWCQLCFIILKRSQHIFGDIL